MSASSEQVEAAAPTAAEPLPVEPAEAEPAAAAEPRRRSRWRPAPIAIVAVVVGLGVTVALSLITLSVYHRNERRLLNLRVRELSLVVAATVPSVQTPLASAAELASATGGDAQKFRAFVAPLVGTGRPFQSVSLWPIGVARPTPKVVVGAKPQIAGNPAKTAQMFAAAKRPGILNVTGMLDSPHPVVALEYSQPGPGRQFAVYAENPLPASRRSALERNAAFSDLDYAIYLGRSKNTRDLLVTSERHLPIRGRQASSVVPFGASALTIVVTPRTPLGGTLIQRLPWIIAVAGVLLTLAGALLTDRLAHGRRRAEELAERLDRVAAENRRMYTEQRSIAQTLQRALLPEQLPELPGLEVSARYVPAASGVDVGGDWYDVVAVDDRRVLLIIGDVSGHGLRAATTMALLRHAALAYIAQDARPSSVLAKLSAFVAAARQEHFATVLCALVDIDSHRLTMASAGHLSPLLLNGGGATFAELEVGPPIGFSARRDYPEATLAVAPGSVLVAFTDGLVERRGEVIDIGLERLRDFAANNDGALDELMAGLERELAATDHHDDTAMVGIQWRS